MINRDHIISAISDLHKSAYGRRPRGVYDVDGMSDAELLALEHRLHIEACAAWDREKARMAESAERFEGIVLELIAMGAKDRTTALRWLLDAEAVDWHPSDLPSMFCFEYDLPYEYEAELKAAITR